MKAAWDWHLPRTTSEDEKALVSFTHELGFDTLIIHKPTEMIIDAAHACGIKVVTIITPNATDAFAEQTPESLQQMLPGEDAILDAMRGLDWEPYTIQAHRWFPIVQTAPLLCFDHPASHDELKNRISQALSVSDGIAFDGFGFANHYACFCQRCRDRREKISSAEPSRHEAEILVTESESSLVEISRILYEHAKSVRSQALVTNHLWPPFRPNPYYGNRLKLDYCSQTISWFYKPNWSLERVEFEAQEMKRLEDPNQNRFVPFIALFEEPYLRRTGERIEQELAIAKRYGDGNLVFCNLKSIQLYSDVREAVVAALA